jgi:hypothetical protein
MRRPSAVVATTRVLRGSMSTISVGVKMRAPLATAARSIASVTLRGSIVRLP